MQPSRETRIRQRAYQIWVSEGRPDGRQDEHWRRAEREIDAPTDDFDEEIFRRDLNEVHLLIEFISSLPGKSLNDLALPDPATGQIMTVSAAVARLSQIRFPPDPNPNVRAQDAALLLLAKDRLNDLARPARGRSVAYTTMFAGGPGFIGSIVQGPGLIGSLAERVVNDVREHCGLRPRSQNYRSDLALLSAPDLRSHVRFFKFVFCCLLIFVFAWLLFTSFSYWDVALGNSILQRMTDIEQRRTGIIGTNPAAAKCVDADGVKAVSDANTVSACQQVYQLGQQHEKIEGELVTYSHCRGVKWLLFIRCWTGPHFVGRDLEVPSQPAAAPNGTNSNKSQDKPAPEQHAAQLAAPTAPPVILAIAGFDRRNTAVAQAPTAAPGQPGAAAPGAGTAAPPAPQGTTGATPNTPPAAAGLAPSNDTSTIAAVLTVLSIYVVPMMFGLLGTLVATVRSIHDKIRDCLLSPRDLVLTLTGLPIGAIAGLVVGLFFNTQNGTVSGLTGLPAGLSLSAAGLAFLAGYAADAFFSFLDSVRGQVFRATNPPPGSDAAISRTDPVRAPAANLPPAPNPAPPAPNPAPPAAPDPARPATAH